MVLSTKYKIILIVVGCIICLVIGFFVGRSTSKVATKVEYIKDPAISGTINGLTPIKEWVPDNTSLPTKKDTFYINNVEYFVEKVDTAEIIREYELSRTYNVPLFNNQYGKLDLTLNTQYNRLDSVRWEFVPIRTVQTVMTERVWSPFVSSSYSTTGHIGIGGGVFYKNWGIEYQRQLPIIPEMKQENVFGVKYKF